MNVRECRLTCANTPSGLHVSNRHYYDIPVSSHTDDRRAPDIKHGGGFVQGNINYQPTNQRGGFVPTDVQHDSWFPYHDQRRKSEVIHDPPRPHEGSYPNW